MFLPNCHPKVNHRHPHSFRPWFDLENLGFENRLSRCVFCPVAHTSWPSCCRFHCKLLPSYGKLFFLLPNSVMALSSTSICSFPFLAEISLISVGVFRPFTFLFLSWSTLPLWVPLCSPCKPAALRQQLPWVKFQPLLCLLLLLSVCETHICRTCPFGARHDPFRGNYSQIPA